MAHRKLALNNFGLLAVFAAIAAPNPAPAQQTDASAPPDGSTLGRFAELSGD